MMIFIPEGMHNSTDVSTESNPAAVSITGIYIIYVAIDIQVSETLSEKYKLSVCIKDCHA